MTSAMLQAGIADECRFLADDPDGLQKRQFPKSILPAASTTQLPCADAAYLDDISELAIPGEGGLVIFRSVPVADPAVAGAGEGETTAPRRSGSRSCLAVYEQRFSPSLLVIRFTRFLLLRLA